MVYSDPYIQDPGVASSQLRRMVAISLVFHGALAVFFLLYAEGRFFFDKAPEEPPEIIRVSLVPPAPELVPKHLPNKETAVPVEMQSEDSVAIPEEVSEVAEPEPKPEPDPEPEIEPEPEPQVKVEEPERKAAEKPEPKAKPPQTLDDEARERLAALAKRLAKTQVKEKPDVNPEAPLGAKDRSVASANKAPPKGDPRSKVTTYEANSPEGQYLAEVKEKVISVWIFNQRLKREQPDLMVVVEVTLSKDGRLVRPDITQSSANASFDQSALRAVKMVGSQHRFPEPPTTLVNETVGFRFSPTDGK